jgi:hypothetical protein
MTDFRPWQIADPLAGPLPLPTIWSTNALQLTAVGSPGAGSPGVRSLGIEPTIDRVRYRPREAKASRGHRARSPRRQTETLVEIGAVAFAAMAIAFAPLLTWLMFQ